MYWLRWLSVAVHRLSLGLESAGYSPVVLCRLLIVAASLAVGHRLWGTWASGVMARRLQSVGLLVMVHGLSCLKHVGVFPDQQWNWYPLHCKADS